MDAWSPATKLRVGLSCLDDDGNIVSVWNFGELGDLLRDFSDTEGSEGQFDLDTANNHTPLQSLQSPAVVPQEIDPLNVPVDASPLVCKYSRVTSTEEECDEICEFSNCRVCRASRLRHYPLLPRLQAMFTTSLAASSMTSHFSQDNEEVLVPSAIDSAVEIREMSPTIPGVDDVNLVCRRCWIMGGEVRRHAEYIDGSCSGNKSNSESVEGGHLDSAKKGNFALTEGTSAWKRREYTIPCPVCGIFSDMPDLEKVVHTEVGDRDMDMPELEHPDSTLLAFSSRFTLMYLLYTKLDVADSYQEDLLDIIANCFWRSYVSVLEENSRV
ncbi:hypothetical protein KC19_VG180800 [Ceratodon purpureus]|uniref:Uncharacterized protein n=1 Tax=Ceratodon purpureus TaxID=3225 RepID=A0A8T0HRJ8_CERPU|nr:hypothetical protein KC19_VG180800 [Ceratodon purpureus]